MQTEKKYSIQTIVVRAHDSSYGGYAYVCEVVAKVDAKHWTKLRNAKDLGVLYGIDISNEAYALTNRLVPTHNPSVSDRDRAKDGIKTVRLSYYFRDHNAAEKLGLEVICLKSGECMAGFGACEVVYDSRKQVSKASLTVVA